MAQVQLVPECRIVLSEKHILVKPLEKQLKLRVTFPAIMFGAKLKVPRGQMALTGSMEQMDFLDPLVYLVTLTLLTLLTLLVRKVSQHLMERTRHT